jgi:predicted RNase H-like nuclease (RuvC/YqgF family)
MFTSHYKYQDDDEEGDEILEEEGEDRGVQRRERNRVAAQRSREKKRQYVAELEDQVKSLESEVDRLRKRVEDLKKREIELSASSSSGVVGRENEKIKLELDIEGVRTNDGFFLEGETKAVKGAFDY